MNNVKTLLGVFAMLCMLAVVQVTIAFALPQAVGSYHPEPSSALPGRSCLPA